MTAADIDVNISSLTDPLEITPMPVGLDAGGRTRISLLSTLFDGKVINESAGLLYDEEEVGNATVTYSSTQNHMTLQCQNVGDAAIYQTRRRFPYFSGKSQVVELTTINFSPDINIIRRIGYFSSSTTTPFDTSFDGVFIESLGSTVSLQIWRDGINILNVAQASWNQDTLSGYNWDNFTVFLIDFLWLGGAVLRLFVKDPTGGFTLCHQYDHAGTSLSTFMKSPQQPIRAECRFTGPTIALSTAFNLVCSQISSEGARTNTFRGRSIDSGERQYVDSNNTDYAMLSVRLLSTALDSIIWIKDFTGIVTTGGDDGILFLCVDPTITGGSESFVTDSSGLFEVGTYGGAGDNPVITDRGTVLAAVFISGGGGASGKSLGDDVTRYLASAIDGTPQKYVLGYQTYTGGTDVAVLMNLAIF